MSNEADSMKANIAGAVIGEGTIEGSNSKKIKYSGSSSREAKVEKLNFQNHAKPLKNKGSTAIMAWSCTLFLSAVVSAATVRAHRHSTCFSHRVLLPRCCCFVAEHCQANQ
jgi:hypothetical protein